MSDWYCKIGECTFITPSPSDYLTHIVICYRQNTPAVPIPEVTRPVTAAIQKNVPLQRKQIYSSEPTLLQTPPQESVSPTQLSLPEAPAAIVSTEKLCTIQSATPVSTQMAIHTVTSTTEANTTAPLQKHVSTAQVTPLPTRKTTLQHMYSATTNGSRCIAY